MVRVIGPGNYGLVNFASAFVAYFTLIVNYGFNLSATREIAQSRNSAGKVNEIFNSVVFAKVILFLVSTAAFLVCLLTVQKFRQEPVLFAYAYIGLLGTTFFPTWLFQGLEQLSLIAVFNFVTRLLFTVSIFIFVTARGDYLVYALISSLGGMVGGLGAFIYAVRKFNLGLRFPSIVALKNAYKGGWVLFSSTVVISIYTTSNIVILGFFANSTDVGFYSGAMKFVAVAQGLVAMPLNQSLYPHIATSFKQSYGAGVNKLKKATVVVGGLTFAASVGLLVVSDLAVRLVLGPEFLPAITTLRLLAFVPFMLGLSNVFGIQGLLNLHKDRIFFLITSAGALLSLALNFMLTPVLVQNGTAVSWLASEVFITAAMYVALRKEDINVFDLRFIRNYLLERASV